MFDGDVGDGVDSDGVLVCGGVDVLVFGGVIGLDVIYFSFPLLAMTALEVLMLVVVLLVSMLVRLVTVMLVMESVCLVVWMFWCSGVIGLAPLGSPRPPPILSSCKAPRLTNPAAAPSLPVRHPRV